MEKIIDYLKQKYRPLAIIVYGSFADGSNNEHSDFDAIVIGDVEESFHDNTVLDGTELDVFVHPKDNFGEEIDCEEYLPVYHGNVIYDSVGLGAKLKAAVVVYVDNMPPKSPEENRTNVEWCEKMLLRASRKDPEGFFRWHWLLTESLVIYCDLMGKRYWGPKKSLRDMQEKDSEGAEIYEKALEEFDYEALAAWISYLKKLLDIKR